MTQPAHIANPDELEVAEGREREQLEGWIPPLATEAEINEAFEKAFDYRGDVTLTLKDGRTVAGYVFDRRTGKTLAESAVRIMPATQRTKLTIPYSDIAALAFTGRDTVPARPSRRGSGSTGRRRLRERRILRFIRSRWSKIGRILQPLPPRLPSYRNRLIRNSLEALFQ